MFVLSLKDIPSTLQQKHSVNYVTICFLFSLKTCSWQKNVYTFSFQSYSKREKKTECILIALAILFIDSEGDDTVMIYRLGPQIAVLYRMVNRKLTSRSCFLDSQAQFPALNLRLVTQVNSLTVSPPLPRPIFTSQGHTAILVLCVYFLVCFCSVYTANRELSRTDSRLRSNEKYTLGLQMRYTIGKQILITRFFFYKNQ